MANKRHVSLSEEDMLVFAKYVVTGEVESEVHAKKINNLSDRSASLSDVVILFKYLNNAQEKMNTGFIDMIQVQQRVLDKIGATDEMFQEAKEEYDQVIEDMRKSIEEKKKGEKLKDDSHKESSTEGDKETQ